VPIGFFGKKKWGKSQDCLYKRSEWGLYSVLICLPPKMKRMPSKFFEEKMNFFLLFRELFLEFFVV